MTADRLNVVKREMGFSKDSCCVFMLQLLIVVYLVVQCFDVQVQADLNATLVVDASQASGRRIPETLFGIFFEVRIIKLVSCNSEMLLMIFAAEGSATL